MIFIQVLIFSAVLGHGTAADVPTDWQSWRPGQNLAAVPPEAAPFWRKKERVYRKIVEDRAVVVSVTALPAESDGPKRRLRMLGAGHSAVPARFAYDQALDFQQLPKMSHYVRHITYRAELGELVMHSEAFGYRAYMKMQVDPSFSQDTGLLKVRVVDGVFKGMTASLSFVPIKAQQTEISLTASYDYVKLPVPDFFVEFGLEVVLQKMAERMRAHAEQVFEQRKKGVQNDGKPRHKEL